MTRASRMFNFSQSEISGSSFREAWIFRELSMLLRKSRASTERNCWDIFSHGSICIFIPAACKMRANIAAFEFEIQPGEISRVQLQPLLRDARARTFSPLLFCAMEFISGTVHEAIFLFSRVEIFFFFF